MDVRKVIPFRFLCMNKLYLVLGFFLFVASNAYGQSYNTSAGLRMGSSWGISAQQRIIGGWTAEGILQNQRGNSSSSLSLLIARHKPIISRRFNFYLGGGLRFPLASVDFGPATSGLGVAGIAGWEFTFLRLNLSIDYQPIFYPISSSFRSQSGLSVRYVLKKRKKFGWEKKDKGEDRDPEISKNRKK